MGNHTEFQRVANLLVDHLSFEDDLNVSVFETNIRGKLLLSKVSANCIVNLDGKELQVQLIIKHCVPH